MLTRACETIEYKNYEIFVGVYPNDPQTTGEVNRVARTFPQVHPIMASHEGPSTKAQNLNDIHQGMIEWENVTGLRYEIIILHDSEDVIHPLSLKCFNYFIPEYDMVQLPVYPLSTPERKVVHWTYADEFAENHTKDMVVRQLFSGFTPSAGVGTAYNRWLIEFAGTSFAKNMFRRQSLTEDYDIALRLALAEANLLYLHRPFGMNIATWAYFPQTFTAAVRQRTRWLLGICIQSWQNYGWVGDARFKFTLYRDRKALMTNIINALAYIVLSYVLLYELANWGLGQYGRLTPIVTKGTLLWYIVVVDTCLMLWRFVHRYLTVGSVYGRLAGLLSIPRLPVGNIVNFAATMRALRQFLASKWTRRPILWEKTSHQFPSLTEAPILQ
jgi:adsorption protein B